MACWIEAKEAWLVFLRRGFCCGGGRRSDGDRALSGTIRGRGSPRLDAANAYSHQEEDRANVHPVEGVDDPRKDHRPQSLRVLHRVQQATALADSVSL